jgi:hypothetical protein
MVLTAGSTGDVESFVDLAARPAGRRHEVTVAADGGFDRLALGGVGFAPIRAEFHSRLPTPERKRLSLPGDVGPVMRSLVDPGLEGLTAAGAAPAHVGFGSSIRPDPARLGAALDNHHRR